MKTPTTRLVELLRNCEFNQPEIADKVDVSTSTVNRWLSGETKNIHKKKRESIANIMGFDITWIEEGRPSSSSVHSGLNQFDEKADAYTSGGLPYDAQGDPDRMLQLAESLIRTVRGLLREKP